MFSQKFFSKQQSISAAFAVCASVAAVAAFVYGATTIGTNVSVDGNLTVSGTSASSTFSTGGLTVGTSQFVVQQNSGNVGIGTTSPSAKLSLAGNAYFDSSLITIGSSTASLLQLAFQRAATTTIPQTGNAWSIATSSTATPILSIDGTGSNGGLGTVGIGRTASPDYMLYVQSNVAGGGAIHAGFENNSPTGYAETLMLANVAYIDTFVNGSARLGTNLLDIPSGSAIDAFGSGGLALVAESAAPIKLATGGLALSNERMRIDATGNVGIGTTTPYSRFHVSQGASATTTVTFGEVGSATSKACFNTKNVSGADISFYFNAANTMVVESNLCR